MAEDQENEPSIEEILDSIRQIISDDEEEESAEGVDDEAAPAPEPEPEKVDEVEEAAPEEPAPAPAPEPEVAAEDSFAEVLAEEASDDGDDMEIGFAEADVSFEEVAEDTEDDVLDLTQVVDEEPEQPQPEPAPVPAPDPQPEEDVSFVAPDPAPAVDEVSSAIDNVLSQQAEEAALGAFAQLAKKAAVDRTGTVSVEDIVREEIRPILRTWVDDHLPKILERLLQEELDKIAKRAMED